MRAALLALISGCYLAHYPVTPEIAEAGTYELSTDTATGTAWALNDHTAMTAGHMCNGESGWELIGSTGRHIPVTPVLYEQSDTNGDADLCVLHSVAPLASPLIIADAMPALGTDVGYVGYPLGVLRSSRGVYLGDVDGPDSHLNDYTISAACDHGASGSAVYYDRGVFGVLVRLRTDGGDIHDGHDGCAVVPLTEMKSVFKDADVDYNVTPDDPGTTDRLGDPIISD